MTLVEIRDYIKTQCESFFPAALTAAGLNDFEDYLGTPPNNPRKRQCAVYYSGGETDRAEDSEIFIIHGQLPGELKSTEYMSALKTAILDNIDPDDVGYSNMTLPKRLWHPGDPPAGGGGSFAYFELEFSKSLDDCD